MIRFPRVLNNQMEEIAATLPARLSVTQCLTPLSTAEMVLMPDSDVPPVRSFVEIYDQNGSMGIYRVAATHADYGRQTSVSLEHGICTLEDCTLPESASLSGSMRAILNSILYSQTYIMWALGEVDVPSTEIFQVDLGNQIGLQALLDVLELVHGYAYTFDQTTTPWTLHLKKLPESYTSVCRTDGNAASVSISYDESDLCTRVTSSLLENGYMDGPTVGTWGVVSRPLDVEDDATAEQAAALAAEYLDAHKDPKVSVEVDAVELAMRTGVSSDLFRLGDVCRVALDASTHYDERIITLYRPDVYGAPENVRITLSTMVRSTQASLAGLRSSMARSNRSNAKQFKYIREEIDKIVIEAPSVELLARVEKIEEVNGDQELQISQAMIRLDGAEADILLKADQAVVNELGTRLSQAEIDIDAAEAAIALKASQETVSILEERTTSAEAAIDGLNASILLKADASTVTAQGERLTAAEADIDGANAAIALKASQTSVDELGERVSAAEIAIDGAKSQIALKADLILLEGYVKASEFETLWLEVMEGAYIDSLNAGHIGCDSIGVNGTLACDDLAGGSASLTELTLGGTTVSSYGLTMGSLVSASVFSGGDINLSHSHKVSVSDDGTVTLGEVSAEGGNFKIADTKAYKDGVSAAIESVTLSADGWSGLTNTVRASNGKSYVVPFPTVNLTGGDSWNSSHETIVNAVTPGSSAYIARLTVDASSVYNDGSSAGYASGKSDWRPTIVTRTGVDTTNKTVTVSVSNLTQELLTGQVVSAVEVYDAGYDTGYWAGYAAAINSLTWSVSGTNVVATFGNGAQKSLDVESYVSATADVKYVSSTSTTITVRGWAYAYFNSVNCASVYRSATYDTAD